MNKLTKEKRDHLILVGVGTLLLVGLIIYGLIRPQYAAISRIRTQTNKASDEVQNKKETIKTANTASNELAELTGKLGDAESDLVTGDPAVWIYDTIRNFKAKYKVDISVNSLLSIGPVDLLGHFPYKQLKVTVNGTAYYHDLGKFIADFENKYPHVRVVNLMLDPAGGTGDESEKLSFRMDIIALTNPNGPQS
jgi:hypothetical protein